MKTFKHFNAESIQLAESTGYRIGQIAELCDCSQRQLRRIFHKRCGCTAKQWLDSGRLAQAKLLVESGELTKNVAKETGFTETSNFRRWLKYKSGQTPHQFLKSRRQQSD